VATKAQAKPRSEANSRSAVLGVHQTSVEERASVDRTDRSRVETPSTSRSAVLNSPAAASSQESYAHAIDEFIGWYCSEPRLAFNRSVFLRYRFFLEQKNPAPSTIKVRLAAVGRGS
jgi:hypothetical protein